MKFKKKLKGFTMMELIVVMAILAVLCGVLVPNALGWIRDSKIKTCNSEAKTVFNTAVTVLQDYQLEGKVSQVVNATADNSLEIIAKGDGDPKHTSACDKITNKLGTNFSENSAWAVRVQVNNVTDRNTNTIKVLSAIFADSSTGTYTGRYPLPATKQCSYSTDVSMFNTDSTVSDPLYDPES
jgi:prepilin-type N-terminal cleavage/methylation domain-containing protein